MVDPRTNVFCVAPTSSNEATNSSKTLAVSFSWFYKTKKKYIHWWAGNQSRFSWMNICRNRNIVFVNQKYITGIRIHPTLSKISGHPGILTPKIVGGLPDFSTWESTGLPCFTPVCTSIYGTDAHMFWRTIRFIDMVISLIPMIFPPLICILHPNHRSYWWVYNLQFVIWPDWPPYS